MDFMSVKNPLTPVGIEPATFRIVAQHLHHCAIAQPTVAILKMRREKKRKQALPVT